MGGPSPELPTRATQTPSREARRFRWLFTGDHQIESQSSSHPRGSFRGILASGVLSEPVSCAILSPLQIDHPQPMPLVATRITQDRKIF